MEFGENVRQITNERCIQLFAKVRFEFNFYGSANTYILLYRVILLLCKLALLPFRQYIFMINKKQNSQRNRLTLSRVIY